MGSLPTPLSQREGPPSGGANGRAGRRISPELTWPGSSSLRQQLRFARDWTELELRRRRSNAECVRPQRRGVGWYPCLRPVGIRVRSECCTSGWAGGAELPRGWGWKSIRRASGLQGLSTPRCRCRRTATSGGKGDAGSAGGSHTIDHCGAKVGGWGKWGRPGTTRGGETGAFGGRAGSGLAPPILTLSFPSPPGPRLLFCPSACPLHTPNPRRPPPLPPPAGASLSCPARRSVDPAAVAAPLPYCLAGSL